MALTLISPLALAYRYPSQEKVEEVMQEIADECYLDVLELAEEGITDHDAKYVFTTCFMWERELWLQEQLDAYDLRKWPSP